MGRFDNIDFDLSDEVDSEKDILDLIKPIFDTAVSTIPRIEESFKHILSADVLSDLLLLKERINDVVNAISLLLMINNQNIINNNGVKLNPEELKIQLNKLINNYSAKDLAEKLYEQLKIKVTNCDDEEMDEEIKNQISEIDSLFEN